MKKKKKLKRVGQGIGSSTLSIISHQDFLLDPVKVSKTFWEKGEKKNAPNGSVMRTSILGIVNFFSPSVVCSQSKLISQVTHYHQSKNIFFYFFTFLINFLFLFFYLISHKGSILSSMLISMIISQILLTKTEKLENVEEIIEKSLKMVLIHFKADKERLIEFTQEEEVELLRWCFIYSKFDENKKDYWKDLALDEEFTRGYSYKTMASALLSLRFASHQVNQIKIPPTNETKCQIFVQVIDHLVFQGGDSDTNLAVKQKKYNFLFPLNFLI
jgi:hypothetical protein